MCLSSPLVSTLSSPGGKTKIAKGEEWAPRILQASHIYGTGHFQSKTLALGPLSFYLNRISRQMSNRIKPNLQALT